MAKTNKGRKLFATTATAALVASAIVPVASAAQVNDYNSIASYAQEAVQDLVDRGVVQGDANGNFQPRKSVSRAEAATVLSKALGLTTTDAIYFTDVKSGAWYYDAINAAVNNGVFSGKGQGKFDPNGNLTRGEAAVILVSAFNLNGKAPLAQFADEKSVKEWAKESLEIAVGNGVVKGDNGRIKANDAITKQDFAVMFARAEAAAETVATHTVKAINNTTVEVTFDAAIADIKALDFKIEGLEVKNAVVKQTDAKTAVLTTAAQTAGTEYSVTVNGDSVGKFTGVSAVIPTSVDIVNKSVQGKLGQEVTVSAKVTVPAGQSAAGIPVTFNVPAQGSLASAITAESTTNADGVATYTYTRYSAVTDDVVAYATGDRTKYSAGKVYWATALQLTVDEVTKGNDLANNTKKSYKVTGEANTSYYVAIKENLDVAPNKVTDVKVQDKNGTWKNSYKLTTGAFEVVEIKTDSKGEALFTLYAENATVTPIVYDATKANKTYTATDLQTEAPSVKFSLVNALQLSVKAEGVQQAAEYVVNPLVSSTDATGLGGREYTVTVTDKDGKLAPAGTIAYVTFEAGNIANPANVFVISGDTAYTSNGVIPVKVGKDGIAKFRVLGKGSTTFAIPTIFLNTAGTTAPAVLDKTDVQTVAEATYFTTATVRNAVLTVTNDKDDEATSFVVGKEATVTYQTVDQNGYPYSPGVVYDLTFDVTSSFGDVEVKDLNGNVLVAKQNLGSVKTYSVKADTTGKAIVKLDAKSQGTVSVNVSGANNILPTNTATVTFTGQASTLDRVNAATTANEVLAALLDNSTYKAKLNTISSANQLTVATNVLAKRPGAGYSQAQLDTTFTAEFNTVAAVTVTATAKYTPAVDNVTAVASKGTYTITGTDTLQIEGTTAAGKGYDGWKVKFVDTDKENLAIKTSLDTVNKEVLVDLANTSIVDQTVASKYSDVETALEAVTGLPLTATVTAASAGSVASALVGETITLTGGVDGVTGAAAKLALTFSEALTSDTLTAITFGEATSAITIGGDGNSTASVSADKKTVTITLGATAASNKVVVGNTVTALTGLGVTGKSIVFPITVE